jgi:hypothetical protein
MLILDRDALLGLESSQVFICHPVEYLPIRYYLKVITEIAVVNCTDCCRVRLFFNTLYINYSFLMLTIFKWPYYRADIVPSVAQRFNSTHQNVRLMMMTKINSIYLYDFSLHNKNCFYERQHLFKHLTDSF